MNRVIGRRLLARNPVNEIIDLFQADLSAMHSRGFAWALKRPVLKLCHSRNEVTGTSIPLLPRRQIPLIASIGTATYSPPVTSGVQCLLRYNYCYRLIDAEHSMSHLLVFRGDEPQYISPVTPDHNAFGMPRFKPFFAMPNLRTDTECEYFSAARQH